MRVFLEADPLVALTTVLAGHRLPTGVGWAVLTVVITVALGRVFCGWVCPLGTLQHFAAWLRRTPAGGRVAERWRPWRRYKYLAAVGVLTAALFSLQLVGFLDPIALVIRSFALAVMPAAEWLARGLFNGLYALGWAPITAVSEPAYDVLKAYVLNFEQPYFAQALATALIFFAILIASWGVARFWCRYLCPLGGLLGLISGGSLFRVATDEKACIDCGLCGRRCPADAGPEAHVPWRPSECLVCGSCARDCPTGAIRYELALPGKAAKAIGGISQGLEEAEGLAPKDEDLTPGNERGASGRYSRAPEAGRGAAEPARGPLLSRRGALAGALAGFAAVPFFKTEWFHKRRIEPALVRPPGAVEEGEFLKRCVKCGECMRVCLTNGLQPTLWEAGLEGIWSPMLVSRHGYCEYYCTLCGQVCPTGAIEELPVKKKTQVKIGLAFIDPARCLPFAFGIPCIVCEEACPTVPRKAIWFREEKRPLRDGTERTVKLPVVDPDLCIGCGICENKCPVADRAAIVVTSVGESRSKDNQVLLTPGGGY